MDIEKFTKELESLLSEHGAYLYAGPEITFKCPEREYFVGAGMELDACKAVRERQPFEIRITIKASTVSDWHHDSGDDRRLHPDLRSNLKSERGEPR